MIHLFLKPTGTFANIALLHTLIMCEDVGEHFVHKSTHFNRTENNSLSQKQKKNWHSLLPGQAP